MKNSILHFCLVASFAFLNSFLIANAQGFVLSIELDKEGFIEGEPIYILVNLRNSAAQTKTFSMFYPESGRLKFDVRAERDSSIPYNGGMFEYNAPDPLQSLLPGEYVQYLCPLTHYYWNFIETGVPFPLPVVARLLPGSYKVRAQFLNGRVMLTSNDLAFTVGSPIGDEADVFKTLRVKFRPEFLWGKDKEMKISQFSEISKNHQQSVYLPLIQRSLSGCFIENGDTAKANSILREMIKSNPNSGSAMEAFKVLKISKEEKEKLLNEVKSLNPKSRVVKFGQNSLKN